eukprot:TRINITY_DN42893_c0_g1_i1.p1 TRINITY_DN42893_c0_g1~~TRINITY_DN42893_c0_g1_i1.p1  ORF type:complete len:429 (+),score=43.17 TRINITY_DN42893_c0_g1_i1:65-1351(+)
MSGITFVAFDVAMLAACTVTFAFSAVKLDLKSKMGWDDPTLASIASLNNFGLGVVVHMGILYDRLGAKVAATVGAILKLVGLGGMAVITATRFDWPVLFGMCALIEAQATGCLIIVGQTEVLRCVLPPRTGTALSMVKSAIGFGPGIWGFAYATLFAPRVDILYFFASILVIVSVAIFFQLVPDEPQKMPQSNNVAKSGSAAKDSNQLKAGDGVRLVGQKSVWEVLFSLDAMVICGSASTVVWGTAFLWTTNLSTFAVAYGYRADLTTIQSSYFIASGVMRLCIGTLMDALPRVRLEIWTALFSTCEAAALLLMYVSDGALLRWAVVLAGGGWGASACVDPLLCKKIGGPHQATLYSFGKIMGMLWSMLWIRQAASEAKLKTVADAIDCVGADCFRNTWSAVLSICVPCSLFTLLWAANRSFSREKVD